MTITITMDNINAHISANGQEKASRLLSYRVPGAHHSPAFKRGHWDGVIRLMKSDGTFPAGLVPWLAIQMSAGDHDVTILDDRSPVSHKIAVDPAPIVKGQANDNLRLYQQEAVTKALEVTRGIIEQATGAGKTRIETEIIRRLNRRTLVLCHRVDLLKQITGVMRKYLGNPTVGMVGGGREQRDCTVVVATFQTIYSRMKKFPRDILPWLEQFEVVIVDECHHASAKTFSTVLSHLPNAHWRIGFSATPFKSLALADMFGVMSWLGPVIHTKGMEELVEEGHLVPADVFMIQLPAPGEIQDTYLEDYQKNLTGNTARINALCRLADYLRQSKSGPVLVLVERLEHGEELARRLQCPFVDGKEPGWSRELHWNRIREGRQMLTIASRIADEGLDLPNLQFLIIAGGGKAGHVTIQKVGRGLRPSEDKDRLYVFDFMDTSPHRYDNKISAGGKKYKKKVGGYLTQHAKARLETYRACPVYTVTLTTVDELLEEED